MWSKTDGIKIKKLLEKIKKPVTIKTVPTIKDIMLIIFIKLF